MLHLEDHIHELRLELRCCRLTRAERKATEAALAAAQAELAKRLHAQDLALATLPDEGR